MLKQLRNYKLGKKQQGFTIIEVMIVLAIAALILVIVFLAVPALQRSSRNTQRDNDASHVLTAFSNYVSSHNGGFPPTSGTDNCSDAQCFASKVDLGYYQSTTDVTYVTGKTGDQVAPDKEHMVVDSGVKCNPQGTQAVTADSYRQYVIVYQLEGDTDTKCVNG